MSGRTEAARRIAGITARELSMVRNRPIGIAKANTAIGTQARDLMRTAAAEGLSSYGR